MKGYVSFLVVLAALSLFAALGALLSSTHSYSNEKAIGIARMEYLERNVKENVYESVSYGLREAGAAYDLATPPELRTPQGREAALREGAFLYLSKLGNHAWDGDFEVIVWCGYASGRELDGLPREMREEGRAKGCELCTEISNPACASFIQVVQGVPVAGNPEPGTGDSAFLKGPEPPNPLVEGVAGVSVYSEKYDIAGAGVFPVGEGIR
ncbi:MAG: hypothetical protein AB1657_00195 [Candidatus Micrarchaeota archaeon]